MTGRSGDAAFQVGQLAVPDQAGPVVVPELPHVGAAAHRLAPVATAQHRPGRDVDRGQPRARGTHDERGRGLVTAAHEHRAVGRVGAQRLLHFDGQQVPVHHRGRLAVRLRQGGHAELHREAARLPHPPLDLLGAFPQVHVARVQLGPGVENGDDRLALVLGGVHPELAHPRPVTEGAQARRAEPGGAAQRCHFIAPSRAFGPGGLSWSCRRRAKQWRGRQRRGSGGRPRTSRVSPPGSRGAERCGVRPGGCGAHVLPARLIGGFPHPAPDPSRPGSPRSGCAPRPTRDGWAGARPAGRARAGRALP